MGDIDPTDPARGAPNDCPRFPVGFTVKMTSEFHLTHWSQAAKALKLARWHGTSSTLPRPLQAGRLFEIVGSYRNVANSHGYPVTDVKAYAKKGGKVAIECIVGVSEVVAKTQKYESDLIERVGPEFILPSTSLET